jgi:hypothetical protein
VGVVDEAADACRACCDCAADVICLGGDTIGDFDRLRDASRERLLDRPRTRALIAPKKSDAARDVWDVDDAGEVGGDICSVDDCESTVFVRIGVAG